MAGNSNFVKCVNLYPEATMALAQFRDFVQQKCLAVLEPHLDALRKAVGYNGELQPPVGFCYPDRPKTDEKVFYIGARAIGARAAQGISAEFGCCLFWRRNPEDRSEDAVGVSVHVRFGSAALHSQLMKEMKAAENAPQFRSQEWEFSDERFPELILDLNKSQLHEFDRHLERLLKSAIAVFKSRPKVRRLVRSWKPAR